MSSSRKRKVSEEFKSNHDKQTIGMKKAFNKFINKEPITESEFIMEQEIIKQFNKSGHERKQSETFGWNFRSSNFSKQKHERKPSEESGWLIFEDILKEHNDMFKITENPDLMKIQENPDLMKSEEKFKKYNFKEQKAKFDYLDELDAQNERNKISGKDLIIGAAKHKQKVILERPFWHGRMSLPAVIESDRLKQIDSCAAEIDRFAADIGFTIEFYGELNIVKPITHKEKTERANTIVELSTRLKRIVSVGDSASAISESENEEDFIVIGELMTKLSLKFSESTYNNDDDYDDAEEIPFEHSDEEGENSQKIKKIKIPFKSTLRGGHIREKIKSLNPLRKVSKTPIKKDVDIYEQIKSLGITKNLKSLKRENVDLEDEHFVMKVSDVNKYLTKDQMGQFEQIITTVMAGRLVDGKKQIECVIAKKGKPEFEIVLNMIKKRKLNKKEGK